MTMKLARDDRQSILQVGSYKTSEYQNIASGGSVLMVHDTIVRLIAVGGDAWISRVTDEGSGAGLFLPQFGEITMLILKGETLYINDAEVNYVPLAQ